MSDEGQVARTELTAELLVTGDMPLQPVISPDGRKVAYTVISRGDGTGPRTSPVWIADADGAAPPVRITGGTASERLLRWAPDSSSLFFVANHEGAPQLRRVQLDGQDTQVLDSGPCWISDHYPLADGRSVALVGDDDDADTGPGDAIVWSEKAPARLWILDVHGSKPRLVDALGDRNVVAVAQRPDGGPLAVLTWEHPDVDPGIFTTGLHVVDPESGAVRDLGRVGVDASSPTWWRLDGEWHVAYLATTPPAVVGGLAVLDVAVPTSGPTGEHRNLTADLAVCPTALVQVADGPPLALFADGLDDAIFRLDPATQRFERVADLGAVADTLTVSRDGATIAARVGTSYVPKDVHAGPVGGTLTRLSDTRPQLRDVVWGAQERLAYQATDGLALDGLLVLPPGRTRQDGPFPLVTLVHGGPYDRFRDELMAAWWPAGQWLASAGYTVFLPNPRGGSGHGPAFAATALGAVGGGEWTDILTGIDLLVDEGVADPDRLGIGGWSHGGFMAAWAVGHSDRFKAAIMGAGISDWGMLSATGENGASEASLAGSFGWEGVGPHPHDRVSPISYAANIQTPVLILHGERDTNVPVGQAVYFHRALRHFGVAHEFVVYPREGHGFIEPAHRLDVLRRTRAWFDRWLGVSPGI